MDPAPTRGGHFRSLVWRDARELTGANALLGVIVGLTALLAGVVTELLGKAALFVTASVIAAVVLVLGGTYLWNRWRQSAVVNATDAEHALLRPTEEASAAAAGRDWLVVGTAIEILPHHQLNTRTELPRLGWSPDELHFVRKGLFPSDGVRQLERVLPYLDEAPPGEDYPKFKLAQMPFASDERRALSLMYEEVRYAEIKRFLRPLVETPDVRADFGSPDPGLSRVPDALCLHFLVEFSNGDVLAMRRSEALDFAGGLMSLSGEETLRDSDLEASSPAETWFQRSLLEEVFGLREARRHSDRWAEVSEHVEALRILSLFHEEWIAGFALFGVARLRIDSRRLADDLNRRASTTTGSRDPEGELFVLKAEHQRKLLVEGHAPFEPLSQEGDPVDVLGDALHPTSRYRLFRFLRMREKSALA